MIVLHLRRGRGGRGRRAVRVEDRLLRRHRGGAGGDAAGDRSDGLGGARLHDGRAGRHLRAQDLGVGALDAAVHAPLGLALPRAHAAGGVGTEVPVDRGAQADAGEEVLEDAHVGAAHAGPQVAGPEGAASGVRVSGHHGRSETNGQHGHGQRTAA